MLNSIFLNHFKCFEQAVNIPLSQITVIYGKNGRGKSSLIQSLLLLSQTLKKSVNLDYLHFWGEWVSLGKFEDVVTRSSKKYDNFQIGFHAENEDFKMTFSSVKNNPQLAKMSAFCKNGQDLMEVSTTQGGNSDYIGTPIQSSNLSYNLLRNLNYISANRQGPINIELRKDSPNLQTIGAKGENILNVLSRQTKQQLDVIASELSFVMSGATVHVKENLDFFELFLDSKDNQKGFLPVNVGCGYSYVLPIIAQIILAPQDSVLIIENPEAHLYPGAQSRLMDFMIKYSQQKNIQLILETHSDHIINGIRIAIKNNKLTPHNTTILFIERDQSNNKNTIQSLNIDRNGTFDIEPEDFMDEWTKQMLSLL